jgi:hypothetical protein
MSRAATRSPESGFLLVGVVMLILALTILGLSLFSLSGYEAQFLEESREELQAFYMATGGLERAKIMLQAHNNMGAVKQNLPLEGIEYARARFVSSPADSEPDDFVNWSGDGNHNIEIRVLAVERGKRRMVEARFNPSRTSTNIYEHLLTSSARIRARDNPSLLNLIGTSRQNHPNTSWLGQVLSPAPPAPAIGSVPDADVSTYLGAHLGTAVQLSFPTDSTYNLLSPGTYRYYRAPNAPASDFGFRDSRKNVTFNVSGTAILLCPTGAGFEQTVTVVGSAADRLIIVAGQSQNEELNAFNMHNTGLYFESGIHSPLVPVILVSDGPVGIDQHHGSTAQTRYDDAHRIVVVNYLSIFADGILLGGPEPGFGATATYGHDMSMDAAVLDPLCQLGLLPNIPAGQQLRAFIPLPGSWREVTENNPN